MKNKKIGSWVVPDLSKADERASTFPERLHVAKDQQQAKSV